MASSSGRRRNPTIVGKDEAVIAEEAHHVAHFSAAFHCSNRTGFA